MKSNITGGDTTLLFSARILNKYSVNYYRCNDTNFIQTEKPYWLNEAYSQAIANLDVGLVERNFKLAPLTGRIIDKNFDHRGLFLDFAGGYGMFTRLMRDKGFNFYHTDKYCQNLFAEYFDISCIGTGTPFELITTFEVFEHLSNPIDEIAELFSYSDNILFSTELVPDKPIISAEDWWYFVPLIGQHIAFYTPAALQYIAQKNGAHFYTNGSNLHLFTKKALASNPFAKKARDPFLLRKLKRLVKKLENNVFIPHPSLMDHDSELIKEKIMAGNPG